MLGTVDFREETGIIQAGISRYRPAGKFYFHIRRNSTRF